MNQQPLHHIQNIEDVFPMSDIEKGMVYHSLKDPASGVYHYQTLVQIKIADFNSKTFDQAFKLMVEKHANLRSYFNLFDFDEPMQIVCEELPVDIEHHDLSVLATSDQKEFITDCARQDRQRPFDFAHGKSLWRMHTFALGNDNYYWMWVSHHAIADDWSAKTLLYELHGIYLRLQVTSEYRPEKLKGTYKDFVVEQGAEIHNQTNRAFWKKELWEYKRFEFPGDNNRGGQPQTKNLSRDFDKQFLHELMAVAKNHDSSIKDLCFAAYVYMLYMLSYDNDLVVGLVTNNRPHDEDGSKIIGCFLNTIPVRVRIPENITWNEYQRLIDDKLQQVSNYCRFPLYEILKSLGEETQERNPFFDTLFNFVDFHAIDWLGSEPKPEYCPAGAGNQTLIERSKRTNTLLDFQATVTSGHFCISLSYSDAILSDDLAKKLVDYFESVLRKFTDEPAGRVDKKSIMSATDSEQLLYKFNDMQTEFPENKLIHEFFEEQVTQSPDRIAVIFQDQKITYRELNARANQLARVLRAKGVKADAIVGLIVEPSIERIVGMLAILKAGGAYMPIETDSSESRIHYFLTDSETKLLLASSKQMSKNLDVCETIDFCDPDLYQGNSDDLGKLATSRNLVYVMYTSGSTGNPKGVLVEHRGVVNKLVWRHRQYPIDGNDIILQRTPYSFDVSVWELFWWSMAGASLCLFPDAGKLDPRVMVEIIERHQITTVHYIPSLLNVFLEFMKRFSDVRRLSSLKRIFASGEALTPAQVEKFNHVLRKPNGTRLANLYGPTEASIEVSYFDCPDTPNIASIPIGKPIANVKFYVVSKNNQVQPVGVPGELYIGGVCVARSYLRRPELTNEKFIPNPFVSGERVYRTGDLVRWTVDGNIEFLGRIDNQVKFHGVRIEFEEIESLLLKYPKINEAVVVLKEDKFSEKYLCAFFVSDYELSASELRDYLLTELPEMMLPAIYVQVMAIPLTSSGKIDRKALLKLDDPMKNDADFIAPPNDFEKTIAEIWKQVLKIPKIGIHDNFFQLGGDSLNILKVIYLLKEEFQQEIPVALMFKYQTISSIARFLRERKLNGIAASKDINGALRLKAEPAQLTVGEE